MAWHKDHVTFDVVVKWFQFLHLIINSKDGHKWYFTPIYASPLESKHKDLWHELTLISHQILDGWLVQEISMKKRGPQVESIRIFKKE